jgi:hypothetical protein
VKYDMPMAMSSKEMPDGYYQRLDLTVEQLPEISSWEVGKEYMLVIKVRETSHELEKHMGEGVKEKACFEVLEVGAFTDPTGEIRELVKNKLK